MLKTIHSASDKPGMYRGKKCARYFRYLKCWWILKASYLPKLWGGLAQIFLQMKVKMGLA